MTALTEQELGWAAAAPWSGEELEAARKISVSFKQDLTSGRAPDIATYEVWIANLLTDGGRYEDASRLRVLRRAEGLAKGWIKDGAE